MAWIIRKEPNPGSLSRPGLQSYNRAMPPEGYLLCSDEFKDIFYSTTPAGFVNIEDDGVNVTGMTINQEALDAYIASLPESQPGYVAPEPVINATYNDMADSIMSGVNAL